MSTLSPPSKPSKWRLSNRISKRASEAAISEIRFNQISDPNVIAPERMSSLVGYSINPAFSDVFTGSRTNEAILSTIAETDLTKVQRKPRKPSVNDEAALYQAIRHLSEMGSKDEYAITVQELNAWRTAVNIAYMTFTEDGVVPLVSLASTSKPSTTKPSLSKSKSFNIPRKPVPCTNTEMPSELSKSLSSRRLKPPEKYSLPTGGHNPLLHSPKLRSGLPIGQMHALEVDKPTTSFGPNSDWTKSKIQPDDYHYIQSPRDTSNTTTFYLNEWSMLTPKAQTTKYPKPRTNLKHCSPSQLSYLNESQLASNRFTKEDCESSKLKQLPDVSGEMEKTYTYSDYGGDDDGTSSLGHSPATTSNHSSPRTEEAHLQQFTVGTNVTQKTLPLHIQKPSHPQIRSSLSPKRSFQDQRWTPGSHNRISMQDDSDDEDFYPYSTTKKPIRKNTPSRKNDMLGMLDFLSSGPPE